MKYSYGTICENYVHLHSDLSQDKDPCSHQQRWKNYRCKILDNSEDLEVVE